MNRTIFNTLKQFSVFALLATALGAQSGNRFSAAVPFDFTVKNQHFAAGAYTITTDLVQGVVLIRDDDNGAATFARTHAGRSGNADAKPKLVFYRYGDLYFLSEVWSAGSDYARVIPRSKAEVELAKRTQKTEPVSLIASGAHPGPIR